MNPDYFLTEEFCRFLVAGAINAVVSFSLFFLFNLFVHYQLAYWLAFMGGILLSFWLNSRWVFRAAINWKTFLAFPLVYLFQYGFGAVLLHILVEMLSMSEWSSPLVVVLCSVPVTFLMSRFVLKGK
ncbi:MAG: GtrA family protein [Haliea sp.]|nr:GtrA family protein [Haliea sp.]